MIGAFLSTQLCYLLGVFFPVYFSYKSLKYPTNSVEVEQWLRYWCMLSLFFVCEVYSDTFLFWLPLYFEVKVIFVVWLAYSRGAEILWFNRFYPLLLKHEEAVDSHLSSLRARSVSLLMRAAGAGLAWGQQMGLQLLQQAHQLLIKQQLAALFGGGVGSSAHPASQVSSSSSPSLLSSFFSVKPTQNSISSTQQSIAPPSSSASSSSSVRIPSPKHLSLPVSLQSPASLASDAIHHQQNLLALTSAGERERGTTPPSSVRPAPRSPSSFTLLPTEPQRETLRRSPTYGQRANSDLLFFTSQGGRITVEEVEDTKPSALPSLTWEEKENVPLTFATRPTLPLRSLANNPAITHTRAAKARGSTLPSHMPSSLPPLHSNTSLVTTRKKIDPAVKKSVRSSVPVRTRPADVTNNL